MNTFTPELATQLTESNNPFPVDFDLAWVWVGYSVKGVAKRKLENSPLQTGIDFLAELQKSTGGRPAEKIYLSTDALKHFAMMANTKKGHEVRQYMIEAEKALRAAIHAARIHTPQTFAEALRLAADQAEENEKLTKQLEAAQPAVDFVELSVNTEGTFSFGEAAKMLNLKTPDGKPIGRNLLIQGLRNMGTLMKQGEHNVPRQEHVNAGRFEVKYSIVEIAGSEVSVPTTRVTNRGLQWIRTKFVNGGCEPVLVKVK